MTPRSRLGRRAARGQGKGRLRDSPEGPLSVRRAGGSSTSHKVVHRGMGVAGRTLLVVKMMSQAWGIADQDGAPRSLWASFELRPRRSRRGRLKAV